MVFLRTLIPYILFVILKSIVYQGDVADVLAQEITLATRLGASFLAEMSVRSPRMLFAFII